MPQKYLDDNVLLQDLKKHSEDAYRFFYINTRTRLFVLAMSILHDEDAAKDLLQEFYTDFWQNRLYEKILHSLKAYLYTSIKNRAFTFLKIQRSYNKFLNSLPHTEPSETPVYFENDELKKAIESAISALPPTAAKIFSMHYIEQLTHQQIAENVGISKATVANHIHRALTELRTELKKKLASD
jgi:RNA polymerase sigma-70 factor (family 1)